MVSEPGGVDAVTAERVGAALEAFRGPIEQVPPQFSAKKVEGESMHRRARRGERVELEPVAVTVHSIELLDFSTPDVRFAVRCSSGTYIRAIARDLGRSLGTGAHLTALHRTAVGPFVSADALPLDAIEDPEAVKEAAIEPARALAHLGSLEVDAEAVRRIRHGQRIRVSGPPGEGAGVEASEDRPAGPLLSVTCDGVLVAVAELDEGVLRPRKVFAA